jgi:3-hydroxybutyrate dehydrogenase
MRATAARAASASARAATLENKRVLVTGSTSGIGAAVAKCFAARGARVVLNGFGDADAISRLQAELREAGSPQVEYDSADLSDAGETERLIRESADLLGGPLHVLVNNAGIQHTSPVHEFPREQWDRVIAINLSAVFHGTRAVIPQMVENGWGRIVNVASVHGLVGSRNKAAYVAAKHGVMGLTKVTGLELAAAHRGAITCNAVCPGWVRTELVERQIEAKADAEGVSVELGAELLLQEKQPSLNFVQPWQLGEAAVFLASDAASQMNGTHMAMDGGWTSQ